MGKSSSDERPPPGRPSRSWVSSGPMRRRALAGLVATAIAVIALVAASPASASVSAQHFSYTLEPGATLIVNAPGLTAGGTDTDGGTLTVSPFPLSEPNHGDLAINSDGSFTFTANQGYVGPDSAVYQVCDSINSFDCAEGTISFDITAPVPTAMNQRYTVAPGSTLSLPGLTLMKGSTAPNDDSLSAQETGLNLNVNVTSQGGFDYSPDPEFVGNDSFSFELCDELTGLCSTAADVSITVGIAPAARIPRTIRLREHQSVKRIFPLVGKPTPHWYATGHLPPGLRLVRHGASAVELIGSPTHAARSTLKMKLTSTIFPSAERSFSVVVSK